MSIANNLLANQVQYNLNKNQESLKNTVAQLSSGLRINSAADDPSGLAISTNLQTQVDAFQQASSNVQDANNAAQVAEGALQTETDILQRIRSLAVEASSSINSTSDNSNLQSEISQLILEVNRISQNTNFNGQALLDGSHSGFQAYTDASYTISSNTVLANASLFGGSSSGSGGTRNAANFSKSGFGIATESAGLVSGVKYKVTGTLSAGAGARGDLRIKDGGTTSKLLLVKTSAAGRFSATVTAGASNQFVLRNFGGGTTKVLGITFTPISAGAGTSSSSGNSGDLVAGVTQITTTAAGFVDSTNAGTGGAGTIFNTTSSGAIDGTIELQVINVSSTQVGVEVSFFSSASGGAGTQVVYDTQAAANSLVSVDGLNISIGNVSSADAGTTAYIKVSQAVAASSSASGPLTIQSGADQGNTVEIGIQATNAQTLRISNINVANTNAPVLAAEDAIAQVQNALDTLLAQRAQLGAVIVRLNEDANNDNVAAVNLQASESAIRDLNVGQATTEFTKLQVLVQVGTSVLAQSNSNAQSVLGLFR